MIALSIRQPWAWHIMHSGKDVENRSWPTRVRGRVLVHVAKGCTRAEWEAGVLSIGGRAVALPPLVDLPRGGIVGSIEIVDCVARSDSPWFTGKYGFVLRNPQVMPFVPLKGRLGFFEVPDSILPLTG